MSILSNEVFFTKSPIFSNKENIAWKSSNLSLSCLKLIKKENSEDSGGKITDYLSIENLSRKI